MDVCDAVGFPYPEPPSLQPGDEGYMPVGAAISSENKVRPELKLPVSWVRSFTGLLGCQMLTGDKHPISLSKVSVLSNAGKGSKRGRVGRGGGTRKRKRIILLRWRRKKRRQYGSGSYTNSSTLSCCFARNLIGLDGVGGRFLRSRSLLGMRAT